MATTTMDTNETAGHVDNTRIGFFDLPREIRDVIYEYAVISMRAQDNGHQQTPITDWSAMCQCRGAYLPVIRARQPYFAHHAESCLVIDRWLYNVSLVSKQFASEIRPVFFRNTQFHLDTNPHNEAVLRGSFGGPLMKKYSEFVHALGPEAKYLRKLLANVTVPRSEIINNRVVVADGSSENDDGDDGWEDVESGEDEAPNAGSEIAHGQQPGFSAFYIDSKEPDYQRERERQAEMELGREIGGLLHPDASVVLSMKVDSESGHFQLYAFDCRVFPERANGFIAKKTDLSNAEY